MKRIIVEVFYLILVGSITGVGFNELGSKTVSYFAFTPEVITAEELGLAVISLEEAEERFKHTENLIFVDARDTKVYEKSHIKGALSLPVRDFDKKIISFLRYIPEDVRLVVYCGSRGCDDDTTLAKHLLEVGYKNVEIFEEGFVEWTKAGLPTESGSAPL